MNAIAQTSTVPVSGPKLDNRRVLAALIDLAIVAAGGAVILAAAGVLGGGVSDIGAPLAGVTLCWALYYYFACESSAGQTVGKRLTRIRVVRTDGAPAGMRDIAVRTVLRVIDMQLLYLVGLIVMLATGERRGRLGDLAAGTMIVSADGSSTPEPAEEEPSEAPAPPETITLPRREPEPATPPAAAKAPIPEVTPDVATPALKELAADVAELKPPEGPVTEPEPEPVAEPEPDPVADAEDEPDEPPVSVKSVETVSAIDLIMGNDRTGDEAPSPNGLPPEAPRSA